MATIYKTNGECSTATPKNGIAFSLKELQSIVGGYIELIDLYNGDLMVINEEGKLIGLDINAKATLIFSKSFPMAFDVIVGDALVCNKSQIK